MDRKMIMRSLIDILDLSVEELWQLISVALNRKSAKIFGSL